MTKYTRLVEKLKAAGWHHHGGEIWSEPDFRTGKNYEEIRRQIKNEARAEFASEVIEALGLANSYPDVEKSRKGWEYDSRIGTRKVTDIPYIERGSTQFLKDIETVRASRKAKSARKRLFSKD